MVQDRCRFVFVVGLTKSHCKSTIVHLSIFLDQNRVYVDLENHQVKIFSRMKKKA